MKSEDNQYKCKLCTDEFPLWVSLSKARAHEDTELHVIRTRKLDRPPKPDFTAMRNLAATANPPSPSFVSSRDHTHSQASAFPDFRSRTHITVPGPHRVSDSSDQIYDDFGGEWFRAARRDEPMQDGVIELDEDDPLQSTADPGLRDQHDHSTLNLQTTDEDGTSGAHAADTQGTSCAVEYTNQH